MKSLKFFLLALFPIVFVQCKKEAKEVASKKDSTEVVKADTLVEPEFHTEMYGLYTGEFVGKEMVYDREVDEEYYTDVYKRITLKINKITKDSVYGQSIVSGNQRPFRGILNESTSSFILDEPGDDKTDGRFEVKLKDDSLNGKWMAFNSSAVKAPEKRLKLLKKDFVYNPNFMLEEKDGDYSLVDWKNPKKFVERYIDEEGKSESYTTETYRQASEAVYKLNASKQKLAEKDLKNLSKLDLQIIKNLVFARHGYSFKKETFRNFFEDTTWYIPVSDNVDNELSELEKKNVALINRFIKYAEDKYDSFGR